MLGFLFTLGLCSILDTDFVLKSITINFLYQTHEFFQIESLWSYDIDILGLNDIQKFLKLIKIGRVVLIGFRFHLLNSLNLLLLKLLLIFKALLFFKVNFIAILAFRIVAFDDLSAFRKVEIALWNRVLLLLYDWFLNNQVHALNQLLRDI